MIIMQTNGIVNRVIDFFQQTQLKDRELWKKFVDIFRSQPDSKNLGWRGEYWGKMMRGAVLVYTYSKDDELYDILTDSVTDMLTVVEYDGRVSSYTRDTEFTAWDLWCRKYVILACEYYLDICNDTKLKEQIVSFISKSADYILDHVGSEDGKIEINDATCHWRGLNSSSILEPIVKLYQLTKQKKYLDFATYIVKSGGAKGINIFKLAYENELAPYQYGVSKAYEMMSCFEGLLEYYYATGIEDCKTAVINFANAIIETELSIIGCSGTTEELFDHTKTRQTGKNHEILQETCVTVTWMKLCSKLLELTGDSRFADCMEQSFYNAYLGSVNFNKKICPYPYQRYVAGEGVERIFDPFLPVDSYSPLLVGKRGVFVGGIQLLPDNSYYGCCACIAAAGVGVFANKIVTANKDCITVNFFEDGCTVLQYDDTRVTITQKTNYPADGKISITVQASSPKEFELRVRTPFWASNECGYTLYKKVWSNDTLEIEFSMPIRSQLPIKWKKDTVYVPDMKTVYHNPDDDKYIALMRGPLTLAADSRMGKAAEDVFDFYPVGELCDDNVIANDERCIVKVKFRDKNGKDFYLIDYSSAGKDWETEFAAWLKTE